MPFPLWQCWSPCSASLGVAIFRCPWSSGLQQIHCHHPEDKCPVLWPQNNHRRKTHSHGRIRFCRAPEDQEQAATKGESWGWEGTWFLPRGGQTTQKTSSFHPSTTIHLPLLWSFHCLQLSLAVSPTSSSGITEYQSFENAQNFCDKIIKAKHKEAFWRSKKKKTQFLR